MRIEPTEDGGCIIELPRAAVTFRLPDAVVRLRPEELAELGRALDELAQAGAGPATPAPEPPGDEAPPPGPTWAPDA